MAAAAHYLPITFANCGAPIVLQKSLPPGKPACGRRITMIVAPNCVTWRHAAMRSEASHADMAPPKTAAASQAALS
jgi:hypothetical protein